MKRINIGGELISPFSVIVEDNVYVLHRQEQGVNPKTNKPYQTTVEGYFSDFKLLLREIAKRLVNERLSSKSVTVQMYVKELDKIKTELIEALT